MADSTKIISLANLQSYDTLIKKYINDADAVVDAKSIKTVLWDATTEEIKFFKKQNATLTDTPDYKVAVSSSDVATLKEQMEEVQGTLTGYSSTSTVAAGVAAAEKNAKDHADAEIKKLADGAVAANTTAIEAINNTETGILKQAKDYTDALANGQVKTNKEAIEAINDATTGIEAVAKKYTDDEVKKVTDKIGTVADDTTVVAMIADAKKAGTDAQDTIDTYKTANDARVKAVEDDVDEIETTIGDMTAVKTTAKTVAGAVDELYDALEDAQEAGEVSMVEAVGTDNILKTYTFYQGEQTEANKIGVVNIPKDLVVTSGEVVKNPEGQPAGTYIKLTIANQEAPIFINVLDLVNDFTVEQSAAQIQLAISETREISAEIVDGSVDTDALGASAVTTAKIADKNVTLGKLADDVQASLALADSALQAADITTGSANGTIAVEGTDVAVKGLDSAAYQPTTAFDAAGDAAQALVDAKQYADDLYTIATSTEINDLFKDAE